jgi:hypothetical protein
MGGWGALQYVQQKNNPGRFDTQQNVDFRWTGVGEGRDVGAATRGSEEWKSRGVQRCYRTGAARAPAAPKSTTRQSSTYLQSRPRTPASGYVTGKLLKLPVGIRSMKMNPSLHYMHDTKTQQILDQRTPACTILLVKLSRYSTKQRQYARY